MKISKLSIDTERGTFGVATCGDKSNPLIIFLHGFPDNYETFEELLVKFTGAGFYSVSMAIRGFSPSVLIGSLKQDERALDLFAVAEKLSPNKKFTVVGHDIGGQTIYRASSIKPENIDAAIVISAPHPNIIKRNARSLKQLWRSRYIILMQLGKFAEWWVERNNYTYIESLWKEWSPNFTFTSEHLDSVKTTFKESMPYPILGYRTGEFTMPDSKIKVKTLLIMGENDGCVPPSIAMGQELLFENSYKMVVLKSCGHFLHLEKPDETFMLINNFITS